MVLSIVVILILTSRLGIATTPVMAHTEEEPFVVDLIAGGGNGIATTPVMAHTEEEPFVVDLIAGGGNEKSATDVGDIEIWNDGNNLYVTYKTDYPWCFTETHLHIALTLEEIPQTKKGNPIPGHFTYNDVWDPGKTEYTYSIPLDWPSDTELYIAAHAKVQRFIGYEPLSMEEFINILPDTVIMSVQYPIGGGPAYFPVTAVTGDPLTGTYEGWCADTDQVIGQNTDYTTNVYSSYEELPAGLIEYPENLELVNWILNQDYVGQPSIAGGDFTYGDVQRAIWELIEDDQSTDGLGLWEPTRVNEILSDANANGEDFIPGCGDSIAVILAPLDNQQVPVAQVTFIEVGLGCTLIYQMETAWGAHEYGIEGFSGKNWATYFTYSIQG